MGCHTMMIATALGVAQTDRPTSLGSIDHETPPLRCSPRRTSPTSAPPGARGLSRGPRAPLAEGGVKMRDNP